MTAKPTVLVEACVDAIDAALEAERGGAGRIELCGELLQGGVTPSAGLIAAVWDRIDIPLFVLVRLGAAILRSRPAAPKPAPAVQPAPAAPASQAPPKSVPEQDKRVLDQIKQTTGEKK